MRYCVWNNKGGVGKTFLTYCLAVEYAIQHPDKIVAVIDMCPQANISEMLLGGNGLGEENLTKLYGNRRTIASYIIDRRRSGWDNKLGTEINYFVKVQDYSNQLPGNLFLLPGDLDLDGCADVLEQVALDSVVARPQWRSSRMFLKDIISVFEKQNQQSNGVTVFIDTNPSFSSYTQAGIVAADRLIVPCTADYASIRGIHNVFYRIFGINTVEGRISENAFIDFHTKTNDTGIVLPTIHSFILNKSRSHNSNASAVFTAHIAEIEKVIASLIAEHHQCFTDPKGNCMYNVKDGNTLSAVLNYTGLAPSKVLPCEYEVYDGKAKVNKTQVTSFLADINASIASL